MTSTEHYSDSDNEVADNTLIGQILIQMKSEFNKPLSEPISDPTKTILAKKCPTDCTKSDEVDQNGNDESQDCQDKVENSCNVRDVAIMTDDNLEEFEGKETISASNVEDETKEVEEQSDINSVVGQSTENTESLENVTDAEDLSVADKVEEKIVTVSKRNSRNSKVNSSGAASLVEQKNDDFNTNHVEEKRSLKRGNNLPGRRSLRIKSVNETSTQALKRSSRRLSKDYGETVLQSAIARKEKSYNETAKPQRLSRRRKQTQKESITAVENVKNTRANKRANKMSENNPPENTPTPDPQPDISVNSEKSVPDDVVLEKKKITRRKSGSERENENENDTPANEIANENEIEQANERTKSFSSSSSCSETKRTLKKRKLSAAEDAVQTPVVRRRSHRRPASPHLAEQAEKPSPNEPESTAVETQSKSAAIKRCLCLKRTKLTIQYESVVPEEIFCTAIDSINGRSVGCNNLANVNEVRRPSTRVPFLVLCNVHLQRLIRHNCCPGCGQFCTEGCFILCPNRHQYHADCISAIDLNYTEQQQQQQQQQQQGGGGGGGGGGDADGGAPILYCLHCGSFDNQQNVQLTMCTASKPAFLPFQRSYYPAAKMCVPNILVKETSTTENGIIFDVDSVGVEIPKLLSSNISKNSIKYPLEHLYDAAEKGDVKKLIEMVASGVDVQESFDTHDGDTALHAACAEGNLIAAYVLLAAGASINAINASQKTPLMAAVLGRHDSILKFLIKNGADVCFKGPDGMTALHLAAKIGYLNGCKIFVNSPNVEGAFIDEKDDGGWTPLVWACEHAHADVANYLLYRGADPNIRDLEQNVPLHWAAFGGNYEIVDSLLNLGTDVNAINVHKESPLHIAARQDRYDCVVMLLAHKAIPDVKNIDGETPLDCCGDRPSDSRNILTLNIQLQTVFTSNLIKDPILTNDISNGKELNPIQCVNYVDNEPKPTDFVYITENCLTSDIHIDRKITNLQSCNCEDRCGTQCCQCNNISLRCWYDDQERLLSDFDYRDPPMIFECNQACSCNTITCKNRVVQRGLTQRFQIFRTETKGWGVRTLRFIRRGTYVCEYIGEILSDMEADQREDDSYLFDLDSRVCKVGCGLVNKKEGETYCIDARRYGNLARFINHHCSPNLLPVRVFIDHHDLHFPRIAFFANRDIAADEELGFDYGEKFWIIKCKSFTCTCGAPNCRYSETTIESTLKAYQLKEEQLAQQLQQQQVIAV